jgi:hypothetical protein
MNLFQPFHAVYFGPILILYFNKSSKLSFCIRCPNQNFVCIILLLRRCYMTCLSHPSWFNHPKTNHEILCSRSFSQPNLTAFRVQINFLRVCFRRIMLGWSLSLQHGTSSSCGCRWQPADANVLNEQSLTGDKGLSSIMMDGLRSKSTGR